MTNLAFCSMYKLTFVAFLLVTTSLVAQVPSASGVTTTSNDPVVILRQDLDRVSNQMAALEKFTDKALAQATSQAQTTAYVSQSVSTYIGVGMAGLAILFTALLTVLGLNIWRQRREWSTLEQRINSVLKQFETRKDEIDKIIGDKFATERDKFAAVETRLQSFVAQEDATLKELIAEQKRSLDEHLKKIDKLNERQEAHIRTYKPAEHLIEQFEADIARVEARFLPPARLKAYVIQLLLRNSHYPEEFRQLLTDELGKLVEQTTVESIEKVKA